jgi:hypothetical protein
LRLSNHLIFNGGGHHTQLPTQQQQIITPKLSLSSTLFPFPFHFFPFISSNSSSSAGADQYRKIFTEVNEMCIKKVLPLLLLTFPADHLVIRVCVCVCVMLRK